jgi:hypothetical protein
MTDNLDNALQNLPFEPYPDLLTKQILIRLRRERHRRWVLSRTGWISAGISTAISVRILSGWWSRTDLDIPVYSFPSIMNWFQSIRSSPSQTVTENAMAVLDWIGLMAVQLGWAAVIGLGLLLLPAFWVMGKLLFEADMDEVLWV